MRNRALLATAFGVICILALSVLFRPQGSPTESTTSRSESTDPTGGHSSGDLKAEERTGASVSGSGEKSAAVTGSQTQARPVSPTGDPELDRVYRTNKAWAKRWDEYKVNFMKAQSMRRQPPAPPEHPDVDKERFRISQPPPGF